MHTSNANGSLYPDDRVLADVIAEVVCGGSRANERVTILDRLEFRGSTFPVEVVSCRIPDGTKLRLFCKYEAGRSHLGHGHRGGVRYEADVYESILDTVHGLAPGFVGCYRDGTSGDTWLFIEAMDGQSIANTHRPDSLVALREAARWLGGFHATLAPRAKEFPHVTRYDRDYYRGFVDRVVEFSRDSLDRYPWLPAVCRRADEFISQLLNAPSTIIHGEFYTGNIMYDGRRIRAVDWESTAVGPGELDLAALTEGWSPQLVAECEKEYMMARWHGDVPSEHARTLAAARLYWPFRWLGDRRDKFEHHRKSETWLSSLWEQAKLWPLID